MKALLVFTAACVLLPGGQASLRVRREGYGAPNGAAANGRAQNQQYSASPLNGAAQPNFQGAQSRLGGQRAQFTGNQGNQYQQGGFGLNGNGNQGNQYGAQGGQARLGSGSGAPAPYEFSWEVNDPPSGNQYNHQESSDGTRVDGSYSVLLPDTRVQTVTYYVEGDSGFVADVTYEGEPRFDDEATRSGAGAETYGVNGVNRFSQAGSGYTNQAANGGPRNGVFAATNGGYSQGAVRNGAGNGNGVLGAAARNGGAYGQNGGFASEASSGNGRFSQGAGSNGGYPQGTTQARGQTNGFPQGSSGFSQTSAAGGAVGAGGFSQGAAGLSTARRNNGAGSTYPQGSVLAGAGLPSNGQLSQQSRSYLAPL